MLVGGFTYNLTMDAAKVAGGNTMSVRGAGLGPANALTFDAWVYGGHPMQDNWSYYTNLDQSRTVTGLFNQLNESSFRWQSQ